MRTGIIFAIVALCSSPATALAQTTSCGMEMGRWVCHTAQPYQQPDIVGNAERARQQAYDQGQRFQQDYAAAQERRDAEQARASAEAAAAYQAQYVEKITGMIREGRCDEARNYALESNDLEGADKVVRICAAR